MQHHTKNYIEIDQKPECVKTTDVKKAELSIVF